MSIAIDLAQLVTAEAAAAAALAGAKAAGHARLAAHITAARAALITILPGQEMIYLAKEAEARSWLDATAPDLAGYPLLSAEIGLTAPSAGQLAEIWVAMSAQWRAAAATLETLRLTVKAEIETAATPAGVDAALAALA